MRKVTRKGWIRKLDKVVSEIVILRDKKCIVCGTNKTLTCGHLFSRVAYSTRWDLNNCYAQCLSCNFKHELDAYPMLNKVSELWGIGFVDELHKKYETPSHYKDWQLALMYDELKVIKQLLENGR